MSNPGTRSSITRASFTPLQVSVTTSVDTTPELDLANVSAWAVRSPASAIASVEVWASPSPGGTYTRVQVDAADLSVAMSAAKWNNPALEVFAHSYVKLVGNADGVLDIVAKG
jgi:hypothetical protein